MFLDGEIISFIIIGLPILNNFLIRFFEAVKHSEKRNLGEIFVYLFFISLMSFFVIACILSRIVFPILSFFIDSIIIKMIIGNIVTTIIVYREIKDEGTSKVFLHMVNDDTWLTNAEERILENKLKKKGKEFTKIKREILEERNPKDKYYFYDGDECVTKDGVMRKIKKEKEFESRYF